jgi:hypothetical protein
VFSWAVLLVDGFNGSTVLVFIKSNADQALAWFVYRLRRVEDKAKSLSNYLDGQSLKKDH